jgi:hypothetical protein
MKTRLLFLLLISYSVLYSQNQEVENEKTTSVTIGILNGGGGLIGLDLEYLLNNKIGLQFGMGLFSYGAGLNVHLKPSIRSSFISFQYYHQGFFQNYYQSFVGPSFVYRGKRWLTFQIGLGVPLEKGPAFPKDRVQSPIMLLYSIGAYFPL